MGFHLNSSYETGPLYTINMMGRARARIVNIKWFAACVLQGAWHDGRFRVLSGQKFYRAPFRFRAPSTWNFMRAQSFRATFMHPTGSLPNSILRHPIPPLPLGSDVRNFFRFFLISFIITTCLFAWAAKSKIEERSHGSDHFRDVHVFLTVH